MNQSEVQPLVLDLSSTKKPRFRDLSASALSSLLDDSPSVSWSLLDDEAISPRWWSSRRLFWWLSSTADGGSLRWLRHYLSLDGWHEKESLDLSLRIYLRRKQKVASFPVEIKTATVDTLENERQSYVLSLLCLNPSIHACLKLCLWLLVFLCLLIVRD